MEIATYVLIFAVALFFLLKSSDFFVEKAEKIGLGFGISPFVIGVTIVAFGTSLPELATSIVAVMSGNSEIVGGTVIGSNITNILLVLGITVVVAKQVVLKHDVMNVDMPLLLMSGFLCFFMLSDGNLSIIEALLFLVALVFFLLSSLKGDTSEEHNNPKATGIDYLILAIAGVGVSVGASYTVVAIERLSELGGVPKEIISLTILALGTSLPEVVVSVAAVRRGKQAIAVGNVLGSNIFNTYAVLGISRLFGELNFSENLVSFSIPYMLGVTIIFSVICLSRKINLWEGAMLLLFYAYYISTLIM